MMNAVERVKHYSAIENENYDGKKKFTMKCQI